MLWRTQKFTAKIEKIFDPNFRSKRGYPRKQRSNYAPAPQVESQGVYHRDDRQSGGYSDRREHHSASQNGYSGYDSPTYSGNNHNGGNGNRQTHRSDNRRGSGNNKGNSKVKAEKS